MNNAEWLILNVDDQSAIRYSKTRALQRAGFRVIEADTGQAGLECVEQNAPDLVMCDVRLPDMSGLEVCRIVKEQHPEILVLQVSASFVTPRDRVVGFDFGADAYLTEPVEPDELVAAVRALLRMKKAEDDLRALNEKLEVEVAQRTRERDGIWKASGELMAVTTLDGTLKSLNPAWLRVLRYQEQELLDRKLSDLLATADKPIVTRMLARLRAGKPAAQAEFRMLTKQGDERWISWTASLDAGICYALGRDVTEEKRRAAELHQAQEQLRQSQKMEAVGQLTGGIAHDFNNLLTGIIGGLDMVRNRIATGRANDAERFIEAAIASAQRAASLTHRLLAFSRRQSLAFAETRIDALIDSMQDLLHRTLGENIIVDYVLPANLWTANTDSNQLETALLNLAINARDAMPDGGKLTVKAVNETFRQGDLVGMEAMVPGDYVAVCVTDNGTGMPQEVIDRAFEPFFTTKPIGQGTGLGLSMIYGFAKQSGGDVRITSEVGKGTTVAIYLPRHKETAGEPVVAPPVVATATDQPAQAGEVVLLVEDDAGVRLLVTEVLAELGYKTLLAANGTDAQAILNSQERIDLLVTDVGLPDVNGRVVAEVGRKTRPALKVLFITGYAEAAAVRADFLAPGMDLINKPFDLNTLATRLRSILDT